jgi:hypothetical protein
MPRAVVSFGEREKPFPEVALRWLQLGPPAFIEKEIERARAEQKSIKDRIRSSIENYLDIKRLQKSA